MATTNQSSQRDAVRKGKMPKLRSRLRLQPAPPLTPTAAEGSGSVPSPTMKEKMKELSPSPTTAFFAELVEAQETIDALVTLPILEYDDPLPHEKKSRNGRQQNRAPARREPRGFASRLLAYMSRR